MEDDKSSRGVKHGPSDRDARAVRAASPRNTCTNYDVINGSTRGLFFDRSN